MNKICSRSSCFVDRLRTAPHRSISGNEPLQARASARESPSLAARRAPSGSDTGYPAPRELEHHGGRLEMVTAWLDDFRTAAHMSAEFDASKGLLNID